MEHVPNALVRPRDIRETRLTERKLSVQVGTLMRVKILERINGAVPLFVIAGHVELVDPESTTGQL